QPDILIADSGRAIAVRGKDGYGFLTDGRGAFVRSVWQARTAEAMELGEGWQCKMAGCLTTSQAGWRVARSDSVRRFADICSGVSVLVARYSVPQDVAATCGVPLILDTPALQRYGAMALWLDDSGAVKRMESSGERRGRRPWIQQNNGDQ
ncbi:MAG: hypothetical protein JXQ84_10725, partial [Rhodospirillaceae bacterium]|nr:hypothetical protein [Rhodospirillaceae bacterium]